jgi:hypothetical protein
MDVGHSKGPEYWIHLKPDQGEMILGYYIIFRSQFDLLPKLDKEKDYYTASDLLDI